ncbi:hypothetical protein RUM44_002163 [Polyplax serrata]|uniref:Uncharacterized protein n=1 Tax=Polyplax serrata TaxID=468196 RepID=A0ABR1AM28_POLSC
MIDNVNITSGNTSGYSTTWHRGQCPPKKVTRGEDSNALERRLMGVFSLSHRDNQPFKGGQQQSLVFMENFRQSWMVPSTENQKRAERRLRPITHEMKYESLICVVYYPIIISHFAESTVLVSRHW